MTKQPLAGRKILVTRPVHQAESLCRALQAQGAETIVFPTVAIQGSSNLNALYTALMHLPECEITIFVSANAVHHALPHWPKKTLSLKTLAIGPGTEKALQQHGMTADSIPEQHNSEGLLELPALQSVTGRSITIFCGENPRPLLADTLRQRGAKVTQAFCYRRVCPIPQVAEVEKLCTQHLDLIISTSLDSLRNLCQIFAAPAHSAWLHPTPLLVVSPAMSEFAQSQGFLQRPIIAESATDEVIANTLTTSLHFGVK